MDSVYVGNLPPDIRIREIDDFFRPFGKLIYIDVNHRANPVYALVQFDSPRNAFMAVKSRHGYNYEGYTLQLRLAESEVKNRRDVTPPPPPPSMLSKYGMQSNRGGSGNDYDKFNDRMRQNYSSSSASSSFQPSQWGSFDNYNNNNRSNMSQYSSNNRMNMGHQNIRDNSSSNRSNISYSSNDRSDMSQQNMVNYSSNNRSNMLYSSSNDRSNMSQPNMMNYSSNNRSNMSYSTLNDRSKMSQPNMMNYSPNSRPNMSHSSSNVRSNMSQQNMMNYSSNNRSDMSYSSSNDRSYTPQENMMNYSSNNRSDMSYSSNGRSNMPQQNMMNFSNTNQSANMMNNYPNNNSNWGNNDYGGGSFGGGNDFVYNASTDPYANANFEDNYTRGLSGAGRKWFNRYIRDGYSPEKAREKALERRTVPYLRDDPKAKQSIVNDPTNVALETIGNTIMSLLSTTAVDNGKQMMPSYSNWGGDNSQAAGGPGPSRGRGEPRNAVSRQQYLKSLSILKKLGGRGSRNASDRLSKKYHTQIVSDYERYKKLSDRERDRPKAISSSEGKSYTQLLVAFKKKKQNLLISARRMRVDRNTRSSGAFRKRMRLLMTEGDFEEIEAKALAVHPLSTLRTLMSMKADCEEALKRKQNKFTPAKKAGNQKTTSYQKDINYLKMYEKYRVENLSIRIKDAIRACLKRVHEHEKNRNLPLTKSKFTRLLPPVIGGRKSTTQRRRRGARRSSRPKRDGGKKETNAKKKSTDDKNVENDDNANKEDNEEQQEEDIQDVENADQDE